jgi:hypothetical protein
LVIDVKKGRLSDGCRVDLPLDQVSDRWTRSLEEQLSQE